MSQHTIPTPNCTPGVPQFGDSVNDNDGFPPVDARARYYNEPETLPEDMAGHYITTLYGYYDRPLMYTVERGDSVYFVYWMGNDEATLRDTFVFLPITRDEQRAIERWEACLRSVLFSKPLTLVEYDMSKEGWPIAEVKRDLMAKDMDFEWPRAGLGITIFEAEPLVKNTPKP